MEDGLVHSFMISAALYVMGCSTTKKGSVHKKKQRYKNIEACAWKLNQNTARIINGSDCCLQADEMDTYIIFSEKAKIHFIF